VTSDSPDVSQLDSSDPLRGCADQFVLDDCIYLDGNSLGRLPRCVPDRVRAVAESEWGADLIGGWLKHDWISLPSRVGRCIARLIGAAADEVVVGNSTSVNLFNVAASALGLTSRRKIVTDEANFPTDLYVLEGLQRLLGSNLVIERVPASELLQAVDERTALIVLSHVDYRTAAMYDMGHVTAEAHRRGAMILWDLSHSAGAVPLDLNACQADFAVGCTYKYLNGGPGSPAFTFVASRWHGEIAPVISGWQGHKAPFAFNCSYVPADGISRMLVGAPEVLGLSSLEASLSVFTSVSLEALRRKSVQLSELFIQELQNRCARYGFRVVSPRDPSKRGSHVAVSHEHGYEIMQALIERRIVGDFREPNLMRFAFAPLYQRFRDVMICIEALDEIMATGSWLADRFRARRLIT
jgi:kynureninase